MIEHIGLVHHVAKKYAGRGTPYEDLVQEGVVGLCYAIKTYRKEKGLFSTRARSCIEYAIMALVSGDASVFHIPPKVRVDVHRLKKGWEPKSVSRECANQALNVTRMGRAPEEALGEIPGRPDDEVERRDLVEKIRALLRPREYAFFSLTLGLDGEKKKSKEVAQMYGCTQQNVYWVMKAAAKRVRANLERRENCQ